MCYMFKIIKINEYKIFIKSCETLFTWMIEHYLQEIIHFNSFLVRMSIQHLTMCIIRDSERVYTSMSHIFQQIPRNWIQGKGIYEWLLDRLTTLCECYSFIPRKLWYVLQLTTCERHSQMFAGSRKAGVTKVLHTGQHSTVSSAMTFPWNPPQGWWRQALWNRVHIIEEIVLSA